MCIIKIVFRGCCQGSKWLPDKVGVLTSYPPTPDTRMCEGCQGVRGVLVARVDVLTDRLTLAVVVAGSESVTEFTRGVSVNHEKTLPHKTSGFLRWHTRCVAE